MKLRLFFTLGLTTSFVTLLAFTSHAMPAKTNQKPIVRYHSKFKTATFIRDNWLDTKYNITSQELIWSYLNARKNLFNIKDDVEKHFQLIKSNTDNLGMMHYRLQEMHQGVPVYGLDQTVHTNNSGAVTSYMGQVIPNISLPKFDKSKYISSSEAISHTKKDLNDVDNFLYTPTAKLYVYPVGESSTYAYLVKIAYLSPQPSVWQYFIDASNGKVIHKENILGELTGTGTGVNGNKKTFETSKTGDMYYLNDTKRNITTFDAEHQDPGSPLIAGNMVSSPNNNFTDGAAVDAHVNAEKTFDFYKKTFNRNSYDDQGGSIKSYVHVGDGWNNAGWDGEKMLYGDGDEKTFTFLSGGLDVIAHELAHAVTQNTADLRYEFESGALNESISDIMAVMVDNDDWLLGEDIYTPSIPGDALRSMSDPKKYNQPDHYKDRYIGTKDNGGIHTNSGINNKAAYLIAEGGTHYDIKVNGIGRSKTANIYYRALTYYLTSSSDFLEMKDAAIQVATDLYGSSSKEVTAVTKAYEAIGVVSVIE